MDFAVGPQCFVPRLMVDLAVDRDGALLEVCVQCGKPRRKLPEEFVDTPGVYGDLFNPARVLSPAAGQMDDCHRLNSAWVRLTTFAKATVVRRSFSEGGSRTLPGPKREPRRSVSSKHSTASVPSTLQRQSRAVFL